MDITIDSQVERVVSAIGLFCDLHSDDNFGRNLQIRHMLDTMKVKEMQFSPFIVSDDETECDYSLFKAGKLKKTRGSIYVFWDDLSKNVNVTRELYPDRIKQFSSWLNELDVPDNDLNLFAFSFLHELGHWDFFCGMENNTQEFQEHKTKYLRIHEDYADLYAYKHIKELLALM